MADEVTVTQQQASAEADVARYQRELDYARRRLDELRAQTPAVAAGQTWYGFDHGSVWMVFDGDNGLFDLWCVDPRGAPAWKFGSIMVGRTADHIREFFDREPGRSWDDKVARIDTGPLRSWTTTHPGGGGF